MSEVAEKTAEVVADNVEEAVDGVVEVVEVVRNNPVALAAVGVLGLAAGAAAGYFVARNRLRDYYADLASGEIAEAREFYAGFNKVTVDGEPLTPQDVLEKSDPEAAAALRGYQGQDLDEEDEAQIRKIEKGRVVSVSLEEEADPERGVHPIERVERGEEREEKSRNLFVDPTFDIAEEMKHRTATTPYVISHDEYFAAEREYDTIQLTYYEKDDTLVGEDDRAIDDLRIINEDNLARFGHGSRDKNIVYIRNERLETDYEVTLSDQSYLEALGLGPEPG